MIIDQQSVQYSSGLLCVEAAFARPAKLNKKRHSSILNSRYKTDTNVFNVRDFVSQYSRLSPGPSEVGIPFLLPPFKFESQYDMSSLRRLFPAHIKHAVVGTHLSDEHRYQETIIPLRSQLPNMSIPLASAVLGK